MGSQRFKGELGDEPVTIAIIVGTRPEIIKMSPLVRECQSRKEPFVLIHSNQHYSYDMDKIFFKELELPEPDFNLEVGSSSHAVMTARILERLEPVLQESRPRTVLVQGDTNTVLAGALCAVKLGIKVGHVEAGLRSWDRTMPEEINRVACDHICDMLFPPTSTSQENLLAEGIPEERTHVVGNTIVDATLQNLELARRVSKILEDLDLKPAEYFLVTLHRQENVDDPARLKAILSAFKRMSEEYGVPLIFPAHPRTRKMIGELGLQALVDNNSGLKLLDPVGYMDFLMLESSAKLALTDSGGVQEETCILNVPCVTIRDNTERPETVDVGKNIIAGTTMDGIREAVKKMLEAEISSINPFGDGKTAGRIIDYS